MSRLPEVGRVITTTHGQRAIMDRKGRVLMDGFGDQRAAEEWAAGKGLIPSTRPITDHRDACVAHALRACEHVARTQRMFLRSNGSWWKLLDEDDELHFSLVLRGDEFVLTRYAAGAPVVMRILVSALFPIPIVEQEMS